MLDSKAGLFRMAALDCVPTELTVRDAEHVGALMAGCEAYACIIGEGTNNRKYYVYPLGADVVLNPPAC